MPYRETKTIVLRIVGNPHGAWSKRSFLTLNPALDILTIEIYKLTLVYYQIKITPNFRK
jgi:hypothetical protein